MTNKFNINELVILQGVRFPEYNGEYVISKVWSDPEEIFTCRLTGTLLRVNLAEKYCYQFETPLADANGREICFVESTLRKKYEGSDFSFTELVTHLQTKIVEKI